MTAPTLAFDVYGTLIDTAGVTVELEKHLGAGGVAGKGGSGAAELAAEFSNRWRLKQLEYTFRYGLMGEYRNFRVCTRQALDYCCEALRADLPAAARERLMECYLTLPAFGDVSAGLQLLSKMPAKEAPVTMLAFSNGHPDDLEQLLGNAGILAYLHGVVSVHEVRTFKPDPAVYQHFLARAGSTPRDTWLISGNPFDICGARAAGMRALWLRRQPQAVFDPWEFAPDAVAADLVQVARRFASAR